MEFKFYLKGRDINIDVQVQRRLWKIFNPLNAELNPIRHLLALVGARHIVHVSRVRVKEELTDEQRKFNNEELHGSFCSFNIVLQTE